MQDQIIRRDEDVAAMRTVAFRRRLRMLVLAGCRQDMQDEPKFFPQRGTHVLSRTAARCARRWPTPSRAIRRETSYFYTGMMNGKEGDGLPIDLTPDTMARGQERFNIYCTPCHSRVGTATA